MTVRALSWVLQHSESTGSDRLVLIAVADRSNEFGECWPAVDTLAHAAKVSKRTAQRCLASLVALGELEVIHGGAVAAAERAGKHAPRADKVTNAYRLTFVAGCQSVMPRGVTDTARGDTGGSRGVTNGAQRGDTGVTQTNKNPQGTQNNTARPSAERGPSFPTFWAAYPRKQGKANAEKTWKRMTAEQRTQALERLPQYVASVRDPEFLLHGSTYLSRQRWQDFEPVEPVSQEASLEAIQRMNEEREARQKAREAEWKAIGM